MTDEQLYTLYEEARRELMQYPGVMGVGLGLKERGGKLTMETAFRVYVSEKHPLSALPPGARIPRSYKGVPTDVLKVRAGVPSYANEDRVTHDPLVGGITISPQRAPGWVGTLGFFALINGVAGPENVALVTNHHVLAKDGGRPGDVVYQPRMSEGTNNNPIATILALPEVDNHTYRYPPPLRRTPDEAAGQYWIDCGSAKLDISISTCCNTNCGVSFKNEIPGLNLASGSALVDVGRARHAEPVFKVGRATRRTEGIVSDVAAVVSAPGLTAHGVLEVTFVRATEPDVTKFSDGGDSGAAVVNAAGHLVGLHYSVGMAPGTSLSAHIHPVLDRLGLTAITRANPATGNPAAVGASLDVNTIALERPMQTLALRERFLSSAGGAALSAEIERHREEVVHLVNHNRRVAVTWHRCKGPAFTNRAINNARYGDEPIPYAIEGVTRPAMLAAMGQVLSEQGSPELRLAIARYRDEVLRYAETFDDLHALVDAFCTRQVA